MKKMRKLLSLLALAGAMIALPVGSVNAMASEPNTAMQQNDDAADTVDDEVTGYMVDERGGILVPYETDEQGRIIVSYSFFEEVKNKRGALKFLKVELLKDDNSLTFSNNGQKYILKNLTQEQYDTTEAELTKENKEFRFIELFCFICVIFCGALGIYKYGPVFFPDFYSHED